MESEYAKEMSSVSINALKLKGIAVKRILEEDYRGARDNIIEAQRIFPDLENVAQMFLVCDILCAADVQFPGCGIDWYWVLQLHPSADDFDIVSQYKKLAALLEPIKNKFPGTVTAIKFIEEAFSVLSDQAMRSAFDSKRSASRKGAGLLNSGLLVGSEKSDAEENSAERNCRPRISPMGKRAAAMEVSDECIELRAASELPLKRPRDQGKSVASSESSYESNRSSYLGKSPMESQTFLGGINQDGERRDLDGVNQVMGRMLDNDVRCVGPEESFSLDVPVQKKKFEKDQIWAVFSGHDSMPRQYVKVNKVDSASIVSVTYLEPHPMRDNEIRWVEENLPQACGIFRLGSATTCLGMSKLSYLVECDYSLRKSFYKIYPREGEVWAMYRNWHEKWDLSNHNSCKCEVVEILGDFDEERGISVCRLVPVNGCLSFFKRQAYEGFELVRSLSRAEMLSFSHRIPSFLVLGSERHGIPKGSLHLEPDALPLNLCY